MIGLDSGLRLSKTNHKTHGLSPLRGMFTGCFDEKLRWNTTNRLGKPVVGAPVLRFMKAGPCGQRATSPPSLIATLGFFREPLGDALFQEPEEVLDIGKGSRWIVVVVLETMPVVLTVRCNLIDHEP
jgi:hypothetical protein